MEFPFYLLQLMDRVTQTQSPLRSESERPGQCCLRAVSVLPLVGPRSRAQPCRVLIISLMELD